MHTRVPHRTITLLSLLAAVAGSTLPSTSQAQCSGIEITAGDRVTGDGFARSVSISATPQGPRLLVGSPNHGDANHASAGMAYVYSITGNQIFQEAEFHANWSDWYPGDQFGASVAMSYPYAVVGAPRASLNHSAIQPGGGVMFFRYNNGTWQQTDAWYTSQADAGTGTAVAISGDWAIIGSRWYGFDDNAAQLGMESDSAGLVTFYRVQNNHFVQASQVSEHDASGKYAGQQLGAAVAISGDVAVIGVPYGRDTAPGSANGTGLIKVYRRNAANQWLPEAGGQAEGRFFAPSPLAYEHFGLSVATDGTYIVVGAPDHDATAAENAAGAKTDSGVVFIYAWNGSTWAFQQKLAAPFPDNDDNFGSSVSIANGRILVAAGGGNIASGHEAYVFRSVNGGSWALESQPRSPDLALQNFGCSVATDGTNFIVGDDHEWVVNMYCGAAYNFTFPGASDSCEGATPIFPSLFYSQATVYNGCTRSANFSSPPIGCGGPNAGADVWYSWTPACSGSLVIDTFGSGFDTILSVHTGCPDGGGDHVVACNDDGFTPPNRASLVSLSYNAGQTYRIRVTGYEGDKGDYTLRIIDFTPAAANNEAPAATPVAVGITSFDTCTATTNGPTDCSRTFGKDLWFKYTSACSGITTIDTCGSSFDTVLAVYLGLGTPSSNDTAITCNDDIPACVTSSKVSFSAVHGFQYLVRVGGYTGFFGTSYGHGQLNISCQIPICQCDWNHSGTVTVQDIFDFLAGFFAGSGDFNLDSTTSVQDIFDFLACYFAGCP